MQGDKKGLLQFILFHGYAKIAVAGITTVAVFLK
jgi:hypothetical protein